MNRIWAIIAAIAVIIPASQLMAQTAKPWQIPGARAGEEIAGPNGVVMIWVPVGEFPMGAADGHPDEKPVHHVRISKGFWLSKCPVTIAQWRQYCHDAGVPFRKHVIEPTEDRPMTGVAWGDCQAYCRLYGLALPTEAQWEYAARGPEGRQYPWGNQWDKDRCCCDDNRDPSGFTAPVGSYPNGASWCGALDLAGNASTWCADWYAAAYYAASPEVDPQGPETGTKRLQRGGYCWGDADECRSAKRFGDDPTNEDGSGSARPCYTP